MYKGLPIVSVIIPSYNYARYLRQRIESVLAQTFTDFEIIILDDASTDNSAKIINQYKDNPKVSHIEINTTNSGSPFSQWIKGLELAKGEYIWYAEADDFCAPDFLEKTVPILNDNPDCSAVFTGATCIDENGEELARDFDRWKEKHYRVESNSVKIFNGDDYIKRNLFWRCYIYNASGCLWRKNSITTIRPEDLKKCMSMRNSGDWLFWTLIATTGNIAEVYSRSNRFRVHPNSTTTQGTASGRRAKEDIDVVEYISSRTKFSKLRRTLRYGALVKTIKRLKLSKKEESDMMEYLRLKLGNYRLAYILERIMKPVSEILTFIPSAKNDRL